MNRVLSRVAIGGAAAALALVVTPSTAMAQYPGPGPGVTVSGSFTCGSTGTNPSYLALSAKVTNVSGSPATITSATLKSPGGTTGPLTFTPNVVPDQGSASASEAPLPVGTGNWVITVNWTYNGINNDATTSVAGLTCTSPSSSSTTTKPKTTSTTVKPASVKPKFTG